MKGGGNGVVILRFPDRPPRKSMPAKESFPLPFEVYPEDWFRRLEPGEIFGAADDTGGGADADNADADPSAGDADSGASTRPAELDLGCGDGSFLVRLAEHFPDRDFLGVERLLGRVRKVSRKARQAGLGNVRVLRIDANYAVEHLLPRSSFHRIHFLCPDPWPKKKHAARRQMCQLPFLERLHGLLVPGGELLFKTDSEAYYEEAAEVQEGCEFFEERDWPEDAFFYPLTDFEEQWLAEGRAMRRLRLGRV